MGTYLDITGQRYGKLVALYRTDIKRAGNGTYAIHIPKGGKHEKSKKQSV